MRKILSTFLLMIGLLNSGNAAAVDIVFDPTNNIQNALTAAKSALTAASTKIIEAKTAASAAVDEWVKNTAWVQQANDMIQTIKDINKARETLTKEITGPIEAATGYLNKVKDLGKGNKQVGVNYAYSQLLPTEVMTSVECKDGAACETNDNGYYSTSADVSSKDIRDSLKLKAGEVGGKFKIFNFEFGVGKSLTQISREAAELNAQEIAVIDAMAREAYVQASNRIKAIQILQNSLINPPEGEANTLKYTTDVQAMIVAEQAFLTNDQNKIAALAVLQQSQRDRYTQRKKEIADYSVYGDKSSNGSGLIDAGTALLDGDIGGAVNVGAKSAARVAIAGGTELAFSELQDLYK
ncbi:MAG: type IV secretion system protein [Methylotenera sp.]|nr:type IV secretion system protein [Methylotenera sp.]